MNRLDKDRYKLSEIYDIEPIGIKKVYDINVEGYNNFIANNIVVHNSLSFDDIMDFDAIRRGKPAMHIMFGVGNAIMGGILYSTLALRLGLSKSMAIGKLLTDTMAALAIGNSEEIMFRDYDESKYLRVIQMKTAVLIATAAEIGARIPRGVDERMIKYARSFGENLGMLYQLCDDYVAVKKSIEYGEPEEDLEENKIILPLIYLWNNLDKDDPKDNEIRMILQKYRSKAPLTEEEYGALFKALKERGALEYVEKYIQGYKEAALKILDEFPENKYTELLRLIPDFVIDAFMSEV